MTRPLKLDSGWIEIKKENNYFVSHLNYACIELWEKSKGLVSGAKIMTWIILLFFLETQEEEEEQAALVSVEDLTSKEMSKRASLSKLEFSAGDTDSLIASRVYETECSAGTSGICYK